MAHNTFPHRDPARSQVINISWLLWICWCPEFRIENISTYWTSLNWHLTEVCVTLGKRLEVDCIPFKWKRHLSTLLTFCDERKMKFTLCAEKISWAWSLCCSRLMIKSLVHFPGNLYELSFRAVGMVFQTDSGFNVVYFTSTKTRQSFVPRP